MMIGEYDQARARLEKAQTLDSTDALVDFNLALNSLYKGDTADARQRFTGMIVRGTGGGLAEARVMLGHLLLRTGNEDDKSQANTYFLEAINAFASQIRGGNTVPTAHLWTGIAYLGLGDTGNAFDFLHTALFLDVRPFYAAMAHLWLGKTSDLQGERDVAREHYGLVLGGSAAAYHQQEARKYLDQPYRQ
jgi:tetratricopeptide (TPR) repeat protein